MNSSIFAFSATETGYNHTKISKVCEDASGFYNNEKMHICAVADGHGSDNYPRTDKGAKFAVDAAIHCIVDFVENAIPKQVLDDEEHGFSLLNQLAKAILNEWYMAVEADYNNQPIGLDELEKVSDKYKKLYLSDVPAERHLEKAYGCTLIVYTVTQEYSFGLQIGDGKCVVIDQYGNFTEPIPWDENCQLNVTTSICDADAIEEFRFCVSAQSPTAAFCGSDGIDDSYASTEELHALYRSILKIFVEHGKEVGQSEINEYLPVLTKKGSGDDVSIGVIIDMDHAVDIAPLMELQAQHFVKRTELADKKHRLETIAERKDNFLKKLHNLLHLKKNIADTASSIDQLTKEENQLKDDIAGLEKELCLLSKREQELVYERQVASFDDEGKRLETEEDNVKASDIAYEGDEHKMKSSQNALQLIVYEAPAKEATLGFSIETNAEKEIVVSEELNITIGENESELIQNDCSAGELSPAENTCESGASTNMDFEAIPEETEEVHNELDGGNVNYEAISDSSVPESKDQEEA